MSSSSNNNNVVTSEDRKTHVSIELTNKRLGLYLEPADEDGKGAILRRFDSIDGEPGEAEKSGIIKIGMIVTQINESTVSWSPFATIISMLINSPRPIRLTFRDPEIIEYRDSYRFLRSKIHVEKETEYLTKMATISAASDRAWLAFLTELGGKRGASFGVQRLLRDAVGDITFVMDPSIRLNAMSPIHGRMESISNNEPIPSNNPASPTKKGSSTPATSPASKSSSSTVIGNSQLHILNTSSSPAYARPITSSSTSAMASITNTPTKDPSSSKHDNNSPSSSPEATDSSTLTKTELATLQNNQIHHTVAISIYKRCWNSQSIGVPVPPGLSVVLPGELPKPKLREKYYQTLRNLITTGGIPVAFRPAVWWEISGAHAKMALHPPNYYKSLCEQKPLQEAQYAIEKDIDRTFPGHPLFESKVGLTSFRRLLSAFSIHNPDIGYCQSINFLAGFLLLLLSEEQAFWVLECLVNEILPPEYYTPTLIGVHTDQRVLGHLVKELLPDVADAYEHVGITLHIVTVEWFMCALVTLMPTHTCLRLWDTIFLYGSEALFRIALVLFMQYKNRILSVTQSATRSGVTVQVRSADGSSTTGMGADGHTHQDNQNKNIQGASSPLPDGSHIIVATASNNNNKQKKQPKDTVAETAAKVLAAAVASGVVNSESLSPNRNSETNSDNNTVTSPGVTESSSAVPTSPASPPRSNNGPIARGGTVRSPFSCFPSLFSMLKNMPCNAHDVDEIMRLAFPPTANDAKETLDWSYTAPSRLSKLRQAARAVAEEEMGLDARENR